jgi:glyoxylase-like metal-dependent hydrolase (beta-lactamase superfamily II)
MRHLHFLLRPAIVFLAFQSVCAPAWPQAACPLASPQGAASTSIAALPTGRIHSPITESIVGAIAVRHGEDLLLFDAGFSAQPDRDAAYAPTFMRWTTRREAQATAQAQLEAARLRPTAVYLTHAHWDHVGGIPSFGDVPVYVSMQEKAFIDSGDARTALARELRPTAGYRTYDFQDGPYAGFERSHRVFEDGSVVLVPAPGHTPGSVIAFVNLPDRHYALIGDLAWTLDAVQEEADKPWLIRSLVDTDMDAVVANLRRVHALQQACGSTLEVVPAHDPAVWARLPALGASPR